jgi:hypothetical protein
MHPRMLTSRMIITALVAIAFVIAPARADVVTDWNQVAIQVSPPSAILQSRLLALVHAAMFDAITAIEPSGVPYAVTMRAPAGASRDAAAAGAAHGVLSRLVPAAREALDSALKQSLDGIPAGRQRTDGLNVGSEVAERIVVLRRQDGADAKVSFAAEVGLGKWQPTPPQNAPAFLPHWGAVKPFVLSTARQFPVAGPPAVGSPAFARDFEEVKAVGARLSNTRTADQTAAAIFWTVNTPVPWNAAARAAAAARGNSVGENARLFAALNFACADSQIAGFEIKYRVQHWRPVTAIRNAVIANLPALAADPKWEPLLVTPTHPDYPSTHALCSGASEAVLQGFFSDDKVAVSVTHPLPFGVTRSWTSFSQMAQEVDDARVWGGIHFRTADAHGHDLGRRIGEYVLTHFPARAATN